MFSIDQLGFTFYAVLAFVVSTGLSLVLAYVYLNHENNDSFGPESTLKKNVAKKSTKKPVVVKQKQDLKESKNKKSPVENHQETTAAEPVANKNPQNHKAAEQTKTPAEPPNNVKHEVAAQVKRKSSVTVLGTKQVQESVEVAPTPAHVEKCPEPVAVSHVSAAKITNPPVAVENGPIHSSTDGFANAAKKKKKKSKVLKEETEAKTSVAESSSAPSSDRRGSTSMENSVSSVGTVPTKPTITSSSHAQYEDAQNPYIIDLRRRLAENVTIVDQHKRALADSQKKDINSQQEIRQLKQKLQEQMLCSQRLRDQNISFMEKQKELDNKATILQNEFTANVIRMEQLKKQKSDLEAANMNFENQIMTLRNSHFNKVSEEENHLKDLQRENARLRNELESTKKARDHMQATVPQEIDREVRKFRLEYEKNLTSLQSTLTDLRNEFKKLESDNQNLRHSNEKLTQEIFDQSQTIADLNQQLVDKCRIENTSISHEESEVKETNFQALQSQLEQLQDEILKQRAKNDTLRDRNWHVMSRIKDLEHSYQQLKSCSPTERATEYLNKQKKMLEEITELKEKNNEVRRRNWIVMEELSASHSLLEQKNKEIQLLTQQMTDVKVLQEKNGELENELKSYIQVLADTEQLLASLQLSVEEEESKWKNALHSAERENEKIRILWNQIRHDLQLVHDKVKIKDVTYEEFLSRLLKDVDQQLVGCSPHHS